MNNKEFISALSRMQHCSLADTQHMVNSVLNAMSDSFQRGDSLNIPGFGIFEVKKKLERVIFNTGTQQRMLVPPKLVLGFKPSLAWKTKVKKAQ